MGYLKLVSDFKKTGKKVVFTHGAFDLFHAGHSFFLIKSKSLADILIVGLEPDENIKRYKEVSKPIIGGVHRAEIVLNHTAVDFVFIIPKFREVNEECYVGLYKKLKPDIVTIGRNFATKSRRDVKPTSPLIRIIKPEVTSTTKIISLIISSQK